MKYIIDTHVVIWINNNPEKLSKKVTEIINNEDNTLYISFATFWEMAIKLNLKKLIISHSLEEFIKHNLKQRNIKILPVYLKDILLIEKLPQLHKDPFDRMLIVQSVNTKYPIITSDKYITQYKVKTIY